MDVKETKENLQHSAVVGLTGVGLSFALVNMNDRFLGMPAPISMGLAMMGASLVSTTLQDTVYELMPENESDLLYSSTAPLLTGACTYGVARMALGKHLNTMAGAQFFGLGLASEIGGGYINENLLGPAMDLD